MHNLHELRRRYPARPIVLTAFLLFNTFPLIAYADSPASRDAAPSTTATVSASNPKLDRALLEQLHKKQWDAARQTLLTGASASASDKDGTTALMIAAESGQLELVRALIERGADPNATNKTGFTALHLATQIGAPKPKKKSPFGGIVKSIGGVMMGGALGGFGGLGSSLMGGRNVQGMLGSNLQGLLGNSVFNVGGRNNWTAVLGTALQGDIKSQGAFDLQNLLSAQGGSLDANGWIGLMSAVQRANPAVLAAMSRLDRSDPEKSALWEQFLSAASSGNQATVSTLLGDERLAPLLTQATQGLRAASAELPANAAHAIVSQLLQSGAKAQTADSKGRTAAQLAQERGWKAVADLLQTQTVP